MRVEEETVWLSQQQMVELFQVTKQNVSLHISNIYKEGELEKSSTVKEYLTVQIEGNRTIKCKVAFYNLDVIIPVGYRVKSLRGTQFRQWASRIIKEHLLRGYSVNQRLLLLEDRIDRQHDFGNVPNRSQMNNIETLLHQILQLVETQHTYLPSPEKERIYDNKSLMALLASRTVT